MNIQAVTDAPIAAGGAPAEPRRPAVPSIEKDRPAAVAAAPMPATTAGRRREIRRLADSLRVVVAIMAIVMVLDPASRQAGGQILATHLFAAYAGFLLWGGARLRFSDHPLACWVDAAWCLLLFYLADGATAYFLLLFFPVLFAGLRAGVRDSVLLAVFSAAAAVALMGLLPGEMQWTRFVLMPLVLPVVGPLVAVLTRNEALVQEAVAMAGALAERLDPRAGADVAAPAALADMAAGFGADAALLALRTHEERIRVFCWEAGETPAELTQNAARSAAERLFAVPAHFSATFAAAGSPAWLRRRRLLVRNLQGETLAPTRPEQQAVAALAELIGRPNLLTVPMLHAGSLSARLLLARRDGMFDESGMEALGHMLERVVPVLQHAGLLEQLAAEAAETERARIGRDLHDSAIQPYIGLKFAIEALAQRCAPDNPLAAYVQQLAQMTNEELASMRDVIAGLRSHRSGSDPLLAGAVRRQAQRFGQLFGIDVEVTIVGDMPVSRRLASEIFHMVSEGLSNIRRHTRSRHAWVSLSNDGDALTLQIRNRTAPGETPARRFYPHSITERAASLGGSTEVDVGPEATSVTVCVPLPKARKA